MGADYDEIDRLIDADPIELGRRLRAALAEVESLRQEIAELERDANAEVASLEAQIEELRNQLGDERDRW